MSVSVPLAMNVLALRERIEDAPTVRFPLTVIAKFEALVVSVCVPGPKPVIVTAALTIAPVRVAVYDESERKPTFPVVVKAGMLIACVEPSRSKVIFDPIVAPPLTKIFAVLHVPHAL